MLRSLRDGAKSGWLKYILLGTLVLAAGGLVLTDVGGFFRGGISTNLVAKGKGIEISTQEFDRNVRRLLARQGMAPQEAYQLGLINQILNGEIQIRILAQEARKLGIHVSDETVTKQIAQIAEPLAQGGVSKSDALKQVLRSQGISEGEFIRAIRQEMGNTLLRNALLSGTQGISEAEATALYKYQNEQRSFEGFILKSSGIKDITEPTDMNLQKFYEANKQDFAIAETRSATIATLKKEMLADKVEISDDELREEYAERIDSYKKPERRHIEQAILSTQGDAQDVLKKTEGGKSLKKAVQEITGKSSGYLGENKFEQSGLLEEIAEPVFSAGKGDILGPIQTALGFHVMVIKDVITPQTDSFESVKKELKDELLQMRLADDLVDTANTLDDQLAGGEELEVVVKEMGLTTEEFKDFNQAGTTKKGKDLFSAYQGDKAQILEAAFDFDEGEASPVLELADGRFVTVRIDSVNPSSYVPYEEVKKNLKERWIAQQKQLANRDRVNQAVDKIRNGASVKDVAKEYGARVQTFSKLVRTKEPKAPISFIAQRQIFDTAEGTPLQLATKDGFLVGQVSKVTLPNADKADKAIADIQKQTEELLPQEILSQYVGTLAQKYKVEINERVLQMVYGAADNS